MFLLSITRKNERRISSSVFTIWIDLLQQEIRHECVLGYLTGLDIAQCKERERKRESERERRKYQSIMHSLSLSICCDITESDGLLGNAT